MKQSILTLVLMTLSLSIFANNEQNLSIFSQTTYLYEGDSIKNISASLRPIISKYTLIAADLIEGKFKEAVPNDIWKHLTNKKIIINFHMFDDFPDAMFVPGNESPYIFINDDELQIHISIEKIDNSSLFKRIFAQEFFHMLHYLINPSERDWVREGLAQFFEKIITGKVNFNLVREYFKNPKVVLTSQFNIEQQSHAHYGLTLLYFFYLTKECDQDDLYWGLARGYKGFKGKELINALLQKKENTKQQCLDYEESYKSFMLAMYINKRNFSDSKNREQYYLMSLSSTQLEAKQIYKCFESQYTRPYFVDNKTLLNDKKCFFNNYYVYYRMADWIQTPIEITPNSDHLINDHKSFLLLPRK